MFPLPIPYPDDSDIEGTEFFTLSIDSTTGDVGIGDPAQPQINTLDFEDHIFADRFE